jgi:tetratricopeptide (TPR) repeat protein
MFSRRLVVFLRVFIEANYMKAVLVLLISSVALSAEPTLIEQRIAEARQAILKNGKDAAGYNALAIALVRRARETANTARCVDAETPVAESLKIAPTGFDGRRARVAVWLCESRWADALEEATTLHKQVMDDVITWGYIADAQTALGNYEDAAKAVQWMVNMRQASPQALQRGARVREAYGLNDGALEWWTSALHLTSGSDLEERAWLLTHIARLQRMVGKIDAADESVKQALALVPDYPWALDEQGRNLEAGGKYSEAVAVFQKRERVAPNVATLYDLAMSLKAAGKSDDAQSTFGEFEKRALAEVNQPANVNVPLVQYYAGAGNKPAEALRIAQLTLQRQHDLDSLEACAQAFEAQGDWKAASGQMTEALKTGVKNPMWLMEAGKIARKTGDETGARKYFQQAMEAAPSSSISERIMQELVKTGS